MKINVGCGSPNRQWDGWVNVDVEPDNLPDCILDAGDLLNVFSWNQADEIAASHVLEHLDRKTLFFFLDAAWSILKPDGLLHVWVPVGPGAMDDPDHVREFSPSTFLYFDRRTYWRQAQPHGLTWDFDIEHMVLRLDGQELYVKLRCMKPHRSPGDGPVQRDPIIIDRSEGSITL